MAWTTVHTFTVGEVLTAATCNTFISDNTDFLFDRPACRVYNSAAITGIANGTAITFDSERYDTDTMHSTVSNQSRITFTTAGLYLIGGHARLVYTYDGAGAGNVGITIKLNGTTDIGVQQPGAITATDTFFFSVSTAYKFAASDYVELYVVHGDATSVDVAATGNYSPEFWAVWSGSGTS